MYRSTLTSALVGGEWSASRPGRFTPGERAPGTHWIGGWVGPRVGLEAVEKRKFLPLPEIETGAVQPVAIPTELSRLLGFFRNARDEGETRGVRVNRLLTLYSLVRIETLISRKLLQCQTVLWVSSSFMRTDGPTD
jgi:hypothetical protein